MGRDFQDVVGQLAIISLKYVADFSYELLTN